MSGLTTEGLVYGASVTAGTTVLAFSRMYADLDALIDALVTQQTTQKASVIEFKGVTEDRPIRIDLSAGLVGSENNVGIETVLIVRPSGLGGKKGLLVEKIADLTWTRAADAESIPANLGGGADQRWPKTVAIAGTGVMLARTGRELVGTPDDAPPAFVTVFDVGPARAIVRLPALGTGGGGGNVTGIQPIHGRWR